MGKKNQIFKTYRRGMKDNHIQLEFIGSSQISRWGPRHGVTQWFRNREAELRIPTSSDTFMSGHVIGQ